MINPLGVMELRINQANISGGEGGFEPTERFPVHSISSAASSTTLAPLRIGISDCAIAEYAG